MNEIFVGVTCKMENCEGVNKDDRGSTSYEKEEVLSDIAVGYSWVVRIATISIDFAVVVAVGFWIDHRFGVQPWGVSIGAFAGIYSFVAGLIDIARRLEVDNADSKDDL